MCLPLAWDRHLEVGPGFSHTWAFATRGWHSSNCFARRGQDGHETQQHSDVLERIPPCTSSGVTC